MKIYGVRYELYDGSPKKTWVREDIYQSFLSAHKTAAECAAEGLKELNDNDDEQPYYIEIGGDDNEPFFGIYNGANNGDLVEGWRVVEFNLVRSAGA